MLGEIVGLDGVLVLVILAVVGLAVVAVVDSVRRPDWAFAAAGQSKALWVVLNSVGLLFCAVVPVVYLLAIRPSVVRAERDAWPR